MIRRQCLVGYLEQISFVFFSSRFALLFFFTLFNVLPIESMSYNEPLLSHSNVTIDGHCLMNAEMVDLHASIYSAAVIINVFFYTGIGLIFPTIVICILAILLFRKGAQLWHDFHQYHYERESISLRSDSPIVEYLRTYNAAFALGIVFVLLSIPCKFLRLVILFASNNLDHSSVSTQVFIQAHTQMQTIGYAFELSLYSYKCLLFICTNYRFRCALKYFLMYRRSETVMNPRRSTVDSFYGHKRIHATQSQESVPFEGLYKHLQINEFEPPMNMYRTGLYSHRSSFKTRSSVSSRRTKEDEISL